MTKPQTLSDDEVAAAIDGSLYCRFWRWALRLSSSRFREARADAIRLAVAEKCFATGEPVMFTDDGYAPDCAVCGHESEQGHEDDGVTCWGCTSCWRAAAEAKSW